MWRCECTNTVCSHTGQSWANCIRQFLQLSETGNLIIMYILRSDLPSVQRWNIRKGSLFFFFILHITTSSLFDFAIWPFTVLKSLHRVWEGHGKHSGDMAGCFSAAAQGHRRSGNSRALTFNFFNSFTMVVFIRSAVIPPLATMWVAIA